MIKVISNNRILYRPFRSTGRGKRVVSKVITSFDYSVNHSRGRRLGGWAAQVKYQIGI